MWSNSRTTMPKTSIRIPKTISEMVQKTIGLKFTGCRTARLRLVRSKLSSILFEMMTSEAYVLGSTRWPAGTSRMGKQMWRTDSNLCLEFSELIIITLVRPFVFVLHYMTQHCDKLRISTIKDNWLLPCSLKVLISFIIVKDVPPSQKDGWSNALVWGMSLRHLISYHRCFSMMFLLLLVVMVVIPDVYAFCDARRR